MQRRDFIALLAIMPFIRRVCKKPSTIREWMRTARAGDMITIHKGIYVTGSNQHYIYNNTITP